MARSKEVYENYGQDFMDVYEGAETIRKRAASMLGSDGIDGARHGFIEIFGNALDEATSGFGDRIDVTIYDDDSVSIRDYGRGVPLGWNNKKNRWNYGIVYETLYGGGKLEGTQKQLEEVKNWDTFNPKDIPYLFSVGLNGVGATATQYTSEFAEVISIRDGIATKMEFSKGNHLYEEPIESKTTEQDGTLFHWKPDAEVFGENILGERWIEDFCRDSAHIAEIEVNFNNKGHITTFPKKTLEQTVHDELDGNMSYSEMTHHTRNAKNEICVCFAKAAVGTGKIGNKFYHNSVQVRRGVHADAVSSALTRFFGGIESDVPIRVADFMSKVYIVVSSYSNIKSYRGQTKDSIDDDYIFDTIYNLVYDIISKAFVSKEKWVLKLVEEVKQEALIRVQVEEQQKQIRKAVKSSRSKAAPDKFTPCRSYLKGNVDDTELWIIEGDSAAIAFKEARDADFQCYLPLRGKGLNVWKSSLDKIFDNKEVQSIMSVLGCGVDFEVEGESLFSMDKLKVGKIIIASDADVDGLHIRMLVFTLFYKLFPELLYRGRVYVALSPLRMAELSDGTTKYYYSEEDFNADRAKGIVRSNARFKGLGEVGADILAETTINPDTRKLVQIKIDKDDLEVFSLLECLFGKSTDKRKNAILRKMMGTEYESFEEGLRMIEDSLDSFGVEGDGLSYEEWSY